MKKVKHLDHPQARASTDPRHVDTALQAPYRHINLLTAVADDVFQRMNAENKSHMTTYRSLYQPKPTQFNCLRVDELILTCARLSAFKEGQSSGEVGARPDFSGFLQIPV